MSEKLNRHVIGMAREEFFLCTPVEEIAAEVRELIEGVKADIITTDDGYYAGPDVFIDLNQALTRLQSLVKD